MSNNLIPINYKNYPPCMFAILSAFVETDQAKVLRSVAGDAVFRTEDDGCTFKNGLHHSFDDQPAIVNGEDYKEWCKDGEWHREGDKPAVMWGGVLKWYKHNLLHRDGDSPAVIDGDRHEWWVNGKRHRICGPAVIDYNRHEWWVNGVLIRIETKNSHYPGDDSDVDTWSDQNGCFVRSEPSAKALARRDRRANRVKKASTTR